MYVGLCLGPVSVALGPVVGKRLEVCWPYKEKGKTVKIWASGTVRRVADGLTDKASSRAKKILPAGALLWAWDADPEYDEPAGEKWLVLCSLRSGTSMYSMHGGLARASCCRRGAPGRLLARREWIRPLMRRNTLRSDVLRHVCKYCRALRSCLECAFPTQYASAVMLVSRGMSLDVRHKSTNFSISGSNTDIQTLVTSCGCMQLRRRAAVPTSSPSSATPSRR